MDVNTAAVPACMQFYRVIRARPNPGAEQIGSGRNLVDPAPVVVEVLAELSTRFLHSGRAARYDSSHDADLRGVAAALGNLYLGTSAYRPDDVFFVNGSTEGIGLVAELGAAAGWDYLLPLPCYFAYEDAAVRRGPGVRLAYYGHERSGVAGRPGVATCAYINDPCGISGRRVVSTPEVSADLTVFDFVHQMQDPHGPESAAGSMTSARRLVGGRVDASAVFFTASKDLSLPGLRAAVVLTRHPALREHVRAAQFERYYTPNPMVGLTMAIYLALLVVTHEPRRWADVRALLNEHPLLRGCLDEPRVASFLVHREAMVANLRRSAQVLLDHAALFPKVERDLPSAGYSALLELDPSLVGTDVELTATSTRLLAEADLRLNPARMFGGDSAAWRDLYGSAARLRVNLSIGPERLAGQLSALAGALDVTL